MNEIQRLTDKTGWRVHPVREKSKAPILKDWPNQASNDPDRIEAWTKQFPGCNWGIVTGARSGILVVDVDPRNGGDLSLEKLQAQHGALPETIRVTTGGGGEHVFFRIPGGDHRWPSKLAAGVDLKGDGGFVVAPSSVHPDGGTYAFQDLCSPWDVELADAPDWLQAVATEDLGTPTLPAATKIPEGQRNDRIFRELCSVRAKGYSEEALRGVAQARNQDCETPLATTELEALVDSVSKYKPGGDDFDLTDLGNAKRLVHYHGADLRYCFAWKTWLVWSGTRWARDDTGEIHRRAKDIVDKILIEALNESAGDRKQDLTDWAKRTQNKDRIKAMVELASSEAGIPVTPDQLDSDTMLLNVMNGTIDLHTGALRAHDPQMLLTKIAPVSYDPDAPCPTWLSCLDRVMGGSAPKVQFLQTITGYAVTGDTREQKLFFFHGKGANGKSTFLELIRDMLGDYAMNTPTESLMMKRGGGIPNDIARLKGARFVTAIETEQGKRLSESLIKGLTGGDMITARFLHAEFFEYRPQFKIIMSGNHKPEIRGTDRGMWRRLCLVPFTVTIPEDERDEALPAKLREELPGVLNWVLEGCLRWQKQGLQVPSDVVNATEDYRREMDMFEQFLKDQCDLGPTHESKALDITGSYRRWSGDRNVSAKRIAGVLKEKGFQRVKRNDGNYWLGLRPHLEL